MATTVDIAFTEFLKETVRLVPEETTQARLSRNNLIKNIDGFSGDEDFFNLVPNRHLLYGSFSRKTKIRPLDDIDLLICFSGDGRKYKKSEDTYFIIGVENDRNNGLLTSGTNYLNSTKVINRFIKKLGELHDYSKAEMHKNMEAATLKLKSYDWSFDIVPCGYMDINKYLIPDGFGNWKLTDPRIDNERTTNLNQKHKGKLLDVIRLMKYWNIQSNTQTIKSYLLECMILDIYEKKKKQDSYWIDLEFEELLYFLSRSIMNNVDDPKGIQGNLNCYSISERLKISKALSEAYFKACKARQFEAEKNHKGAISVWGEILGDSFPDYS